jgi:arginine utilization protein RocB
MNRAHTKELAMALMAVPSVTDSDGERAFAFHLRDILASWPYFKARPDRMKLVRTLDDPMERYVLVACAGSGRVPAPGADDVSPAVVLTGHYDVVSVGNFGSLAPWAFDPDALAPRLVSALEAEVAASGSRGEAAGDSVLRALDDVRSGEFLPGRGLLDMKAGLAAGLAVLEDFAAAIDHASQDGQATHDGAEGFGALVFLAVPDEEGSSHGMLSAVTALPGILAGWGLEAVAAINLDAAVDQGDGEAGRAVFAGSVGKLHPFSMFVGLPTHAGAPFDGVNPALPAGEFARLVECSGHLFDPPSGEVSASGEPAGVRVVTASVSTAGEPPAPPTILYFRELRDHYDVTTPEAVFVSVNVLTNSEGPQAVLAAVSRLAAKSMEAALATLRTRAAAHSLRCGRPFSPPDRAPRVVPWAGLEAAARLADGAAFERLKAEATSAADRMGAFAEFVAETARLAALPGPAAVVGLAPPYYPRAALNPDRDRAFLDAIGSTIAWAAAEGLGRLSLRPFFPGISDMSFLYPMDDPGQRRQASAACPLGLDPLPAGFACPVVNIGPWGRDYHQRLERMHASYAFETLPRVVEHLAKSMLVIHGVSSSMTYPSGEADGPG